MAKLPKSTKVVVIRKSSTQGSWPNDALLEEKPIQALKSGEILVKMQAVALNHRELWIRRGQYPRIVFGSAFGADGVGTVVDSAEPNDPLLQNRVFLVPMRGWETHPEAPESSSHFGILGGGRIPPIGTFAEYVVVERDQVILAPDHLDDIHMAAWPLAGLTAWRAAIVNAQVQSGQNVLITGIGGGVALLAMQICLAKGATVYVTSGSDDKITRAIRLGARAGVNYKSNDWPTQIAVALKSAGDGRDTVELDAIIDSGGGDIFGQTGRILKAGGRVVCYGMTANPKVTFTMREVLKNQRLIGSTMGSRKDMIDATIFMAQHKIVPVVSRVLEGLESAEEGFQLIERGDHFGKIVIKIGGRDKTKL